MIMTESRAVVHVEPPAETSSQEQADDLLIVKVEEEDCSWMQGYSRPVLETFTSASSTSSTMKQRDPGMLSASSGCSAVSG